MPCYLKNLGGLDTTVYYSANKYLQFLWTLQCLNFHLCVRQRLIRGLKQLPLLLCCRRISFSILLLWLSPRIESVYRMFYWKFWRMRKRCVPGPFSSTKGPGTRLDTTVLSFALITIPTAMNEWCFLGIAFYYGNNDFIVWQIWRMIGSYIATLPRNKKSISNVASNDDCWTIQ